MEEKYFHTLELNGLLGELIKFAVSAALLQMYSLDNDFSLRLYQSNLLDIDELMNFRQKLLANTNKTVGISEQEFTWLYLCHYIVVCFTEDKEAFYKWFLTFEDKAVHVDDSNDFRLVTRNAHADVVRVMEDCTLWTEGMQTKKEELEKYISLKGEN